MALALAGWIVAGCAGPVPAPASETAASAPAPLLWRARSLAPGAGTLFLFGSIHVGRPDGIDYGPAVRAAYAATEELVVEVDLSGVDPHQLASRAVTYVMLPPGETLRDHVAPATWQALEARVREWGLSIEAVETLKPWAVSTLLALAQFQAAGYDEQHGVDRRFLERAAGERTIRGLETPESQWQIFDGLDPELQELMLSDALARMDEDPGAMIDAWERGDEEALTRIIFGPLEESTRYADFYDALFFDRNETMTEALVSLSRDGRERFVVLGAGHMVGPRGIPALLSERGFEVERISGG